MTRPTALVVERRRVSEGTAAAAAGDAQIANTGTAAASRVALRLRQQAWDGGLKAALDTVGVELSAPPEKFRVHEIWGSRVADV